MAVAALIPLAVDALSTFNALFPLIQRQMSGGGEATEEEVRQALAGKDDALKRLDEEIKKAGG